MFLKKLGFFLFGIVLTGGSVWIPALRTAGLEACGPIIGILFIVFSLFGELPWFLSWTQKLGAKLYPGIIGATLLLLIPLLLPTSLHESAFFAISPRVWAAYISIVLVGISFETSSLPQKVYHFCKSLPIQPYVLIPLYVLIAGLLGNILDGVSIVIISTILLSHLLPKKWSLHALFALLFGGLISNLITVAAEPTNIKFADALGSILDNQHPSFWITNWPICIFGILIPAFSLRLLLKKNNVSWKHHPLQQLHAIAHIHEESGLVDVFLAQTAILLLALGVIGHAVLENIPQILQVALWLLLLPAGIAALLHLSLTKTLQGAGKHLKEQSPVWVKLMLIFSLLWFLKNGLTAPTQVLTHFFALSAPLRYLLMIFLSLGSAVTDNVALAAMQGSLITVSPLAIWQIRLLLILLTWSGGLTPFGCLQSLSINHRLKLTTSQWLSHTPLWAMLALAGGLLGLFVTQVLY